MPDTRDLRTARLNAGLSQRQLATRIGVPRNTIAAVENSDGTYRPHPANAKPIADFLGLTVSEAFPVDEDAIA